MKAAHHCECIEIPLNQILGIKRISVIFMYFTTIKRSIMDVLKLLKGKLSQSVNPERTEEGETWAEHMSVDTRVR